MNLNIIQPIKLLKGSHPDTAKTGQGCFMNVIAYLNGDPAITDQSPCVCVTVRPIAVFLNDYLADDERHQMLPYIERAMGSATEDKEVIRFRVQKVIELANTMASIVARSVTAVATLEAALAAEAAAWAAEAATESAWVTAAQAARAAEAAWAAAGSPTIRKKIITACFDYLDAVLPKTVEIEPIVYQRAKRLLELA